MTEEIKKTVKVLREGGIILYPSDTTWGIGCDATNERAVERILEITQSNHSESIVLLIDQPGKLESYVREVPEIAWDLIEVSDKPLTIIYPEAKNIASNIVATDKSIGIRVTKENFSSKLCFQFRNPIVFVSANSKGQNAPKHFSEISEKIKSAVDYVVNFKQEDISSPDSASVIKLGIGNTIQIIKD
jgi:L-threonylcarbamoyladenylate synthase